MPIHTGPHNTNSFKNGLLLKSIVSIIIISTLGVSSGLITSTGLSDWYQQIEKPPFTPPNWVFGPAWTIIYILMGLSFARIWQLYSITRYPLIKELSRRAIILFSLHMLLNLSWTPVFFGLPMPGLASIFIFLLLASIAFMIRYFFRLDRLASFLIIPYLIWVTFASLLNISIFVLN